MTEPALTEPAIDPEILAHHERLSPVSSRFLEYAVGCAESLETVRCEGHPRIDDYLYKYPFHVQSWPMLYDERKLAELRHVVPAMAKIFRSVPERMFDNDPKRLAEFLGFEPTLVRSMLEPPTGLEWALGRGDFVEGERGMQCVEWNFSARLGGWQIQLLQDIWKYAPWMQPFLDQIDCEIDYRSPIVELFHHTLEVAKLRGLDRSGELNVAFVTPVECPPEELMIRRDMLASFAKLYKQFLAEHGGGLEGVLVGCYPKEFDARADGVYVDGLRTHVLVEYGYDLHRGDINHLFRQDKVQIFNGPAYELISDKRIMALLSQWADSDLFDADERRLLERHLPWTRLLQADYTEFRGEREFLPDLLEDRQNEFVLKRGDSYGGNAVIIGCKTDPDRWLDLCEESLEQDDWIVQEWAPPRPMLFVFEGQAIPHDVVWGHFAFGDRYTGSFIRTMPHGGTGVVNAGQGAFEGAVFEALPRNGAKP